MSGKRKKAGNWRYIVIYLMIVAILIYVLIQGFFLVKTGKASYVVAESGDLQNIIEVDGVLTRQEQLVLASEAGVVEYYYPSNRHLSRGALVCALIDTEYGALLEEKMQEVYRQMINEAASAEYAEDFERLDQKISDQISSYLTQKQATGFSGLYTLKADIQNTMFQRSNLLAISQNSRIRALLKEQGIYQAKMDSDSVQMTLPYAGLICYTYDGYEGWSADQVQENFVRRYDSEYKTISLNLQEVRKGDPLYRLITGNEWYITVFADQDQADFFHEEDFLDFYLGTEAVSGIVYRVEASGDMTKVIIRMTEYLDEFSNQRVMRVRFLRSGSQGIKIPLECILQKEYFVVNGNYLYKSGDRIGLMIRSESRDEFVPIDILKDEGPGGLMDAMHRVWINLPRGVSEGALMIANGSDLTKELREKTVESYVNTVNGGYQVEKIIQIDYTADLYAIVSGIDLYDRVQIP
ncbi:MAG: hypothetical protein IJM90_03940 [Firmicutes bacterium]|nr:hypothetical protein [Bacillota bacterium]